MEDARQEHSPNRMTFWTEFGTSDGIKAIDGKISARMREIFEEVSSPYGIEIAQWEAAPDRVAIRAGVDGITCGLPSILRKFRARTNEAIASEYPDLEKELGGRPFLEKNNYMKKEPGE